MKEVKVYGGYDEKDDMYVARFEWRDVNSEVRGHTKNTKHLRETMGVIRAIEHAISYCELGCSEYKILHNSEFVRDMMRDNFRSPYPEVASARTFLKDYRRNLVYMGGDSSEK